jgi:rubrerythrin
MDREKVMKQLENDAIATDTGYVEVPLWLFSAIISLLKEQESVVAHWDDDTGHWIEGDRNGIDTHARTTGEMIDTFRCSWCGFYQYWKTPFCPNCGAKMERSVK